MLRYLFRYLLLQSKILQVGLFLMEGVYDVATNIESHRYTPIEMPPDRNSCYPPLFPQASVCVQRQGP